MNTLYSLKDFAQPGTIKDVDGKQGIVSGYFAAFDNVDSDGDVIRKGAFTKTILENGPQSSRPRIKHLLNHKIEKPIGKLLTISEDNYGLAYESQIGTHSLGQDFIKMVESGLITEHSIGFNIVKRNQLQDWDGYMKNPAGGWFEITEVRLFEGSSLTAWGANEMTPLTGMKSAVDLNEIIERQRAIEKFCRNTDATDETIESLLIHSKQLTQIILDLKATKPLEESTLPDVKGVFDTFIHNLKST